MKKVVITLVVLVLGVWGMFGLAKSSGSLLDREGELVTATFGTIDLPVNASGEAKEARRVQIKSKASGAIEKILVREGDRVAKGDLLIRLEKKDEQRNVNRAKNEVMRLEATVAEAETAHKQAERDFPINLRQAQANLKSALAEQKNRKFTYDRIQALYDGGKETDQALVGGESGFLQAEANVSLMEAELDRANQGELDVKRAFDRINMQRASLAVAKEALAEAEQRLEETDIRSPIDGLVVRRLASEGQIASSAISVVGGGSPLLELADTSEIIVEAQVDEADIDRVSRLRQEGLKLGDPPEGMTAPDAPTRPDEVTVEFDGLRDLTYVGRIREIAQEPEDRANIITYKVRIVLYPCENLSRVRLGMQSTVDFRPEEAEGVLVPYRAVHKKAEGFFIVHVPEGEVGRRKPVERRIEIGLSNGIEVIVTEGIAKDDEVYTVLPVRFGDKDKES